MSSVRLGWIAAVCAALLWAAPAFGQRRAQETITDHTVKARAFETHARSGLVNHEVGTLRAWLGEAQAYLAQRDNELLAQALHRVKAQSGLIEALLARAEAAAAAETLSAAAEATAKAAAKTRKAAFEVEQQLVELEKQTESLRQGSEP